MERKEIGALGEKLAKDLLKKKGYAIVETNCRYREAEIDIVARKKDVIVFVEVRTKTNRNFGTPEESITREKMRKLRTAALRYLSSHEKMPQNWRIDLVAVELDDCNKVTRIELIENAVGG